MMNANTITRVTAIFLLLCMGAFFSASNEVKAQDQLSKPVVEKRVGQDGLVELEGERFFRIPSKFGPFSSEERAGNVIKKLDLLLDDPNFDPDKITISVSESTVDVISGEVIIATVTKADAEASDKTQLELAEFYVERLKENLPELKNKRTISGALEDVSVENFRKDIVGIFLEPAALKFLAALMGMLIIMSIVAIIRKSLRRYVHDSTNRYNARKIVTFSGYCLCILFVTVVFRDALGNLAVILGAATAGIAFALKEVIISIAGWVAVTFGDFYKVGDRVELGGIKGDVIDIGFGRTTLMELGEWVKGDLYTGRIVRVANSFVFKDPMFNYSRDFPFLWDEMTVPVKYGSDYELALSTLQNSVEEVCGGYVEEANKHWKHITKKFLVEDAQIEPMVTYFFNDNWVEYTVRYVVDYKKRRTVKFELHRKILKEFESHSDKVGLASATFHLVEAPTFNVHLTEQQGRQAVSK